MGNIYFSTSSKNIHALEAVKLGNEIISLYMSSSISYKKESVKKTEGFFKEIICYAGGNPADTLSNVKNKILSRFADGARIKWTEVELAYHRVEAYLKTGEIEEFGIDHNARFVEWMLYEMKIVAREKNTRLIFSDENKRYLNKSPIFFNREDETIYAKKKDMRGMMFIRNAYRAEKYAREIDGCNDMYTPLILERMAVEQYLKALCEKHKIYETVQNKKTKKTEKICPPKFASTCRTSLAAKKIISSSISNEIYAVLQRGNVNTHEGYASYAFAVIHGLELLKYCLKYFEK